MYDLIIIKDLTFRYDDEFIFNRFNLNIKENSWVTLVGPNGSGKSTLIKILLGLLTADGYISVIQKVLSSESIRDIRSQIGVVFENPANCFVAETVMDEIAFSLENLEYPKAKINKRISEIANSLGITKLLERNPYTLSGGEKQLVALASALVHEPKILILDEAFTRIDNQDKARILEIIEKIHEEKKIAIINITHDMEEAIYGDDIVVINGGKIVLKGPKELVLKEEKILHELGLELPFMASLSLKLQYYNLIDKMIFDMDELVNILWK